MNQHPATVTVVVCTASHERLALLRQCVDSLLGGTRRAEEIIVVVDHNPSLKTQLASTLPAAIHVLETDRKGISEARNVGLGAAHSDIVAFVDDDAVVERTWLERLVAAFEREPVLIGAGGEIVPRWDGDGEWLPDELLWAVGCTYRGHRQTPGPIRNPIGCNMAFRRDSLLDVGGFAGEFGKLGNTLLTCDETEVCLRLAARFGENRIQYVPGARVVHHLATARLTPRALARRAISEGLSKARLRRRYPAGALSNETAYVRQLLLRTVPLLLLRAVRHLDVRALRGVGAIVVTLGLTSASFGAAMTLPRFRER
jgi:GT2 family glycosyltransferase